MSGTLGFGTAALRACSESGTMCPFILPSLAQSPYGFFCASWLPWYEGIGSYKILRALEGVRSGLGYQGIGHGLYICLVFK